MRDKMKIRECATGHKGPFKDNGGEFVICESCDGIIGRELVRKNV